MATSKVRRPPGAATKGLFRKAWFRRPRKELGNCYAHIPAALAPRPPGNYAKWPRKFFTTCVGGSVDAMELESVIESIEHLGKRLPRHITIYYGGGEDSKCARSRMWAKTLGAGHMFTSTSVMDASLKGEFRKQRPEFFGESPCRLQEAGAFQLD